MKFSQRIQPKDFSGSLELKITKPDSSPAKFAVENISLSSDQKTLAFKINVSESFTEAKFLVDGM